MRSPTLLPIRMNAAETSASSAMADWTPLTVVPISRTTAEIDTFISDVSTTSTNIAIASRMASRWLLFAVSGTPVLTLWVIRVLLDLLTHASCQRVCQMGLGHHPPAGDPDLGWRPQASHCCRVILYMTHSRPSSVSEPAGIQPAFRKTVRIAALAGSVDASTVPAAACSKSQ